MRGLRETFPLHARWSSRRSEDWKPRECRGGSTPEMTEADPLGIGTVLSYDLQARISWAVGESWTVTRMLKGDRMNDRRVSRWMGPLGILAPLAIFIGLGPLGGNEPSENASGAKVAQYMNAHVATNWASIYVVGLGLALAVLFFSQLRTVLRDASGGQSFWSNVVYAGGLLLVVGMVILGAFQVVLIVAAHNHEYGIAKLVNFVGDNDELGFIFGTALLTLSTGFAILTNRVTPLPKTLGWWSLLVGVVACLGPVGFFAILFGLPIWFIATGWVITVKARKNTLALAGEGPAIVRDADLMIQR